MKKKKIIKRSSLTLKQSRFLKEYFKSGNGTQAIMKAYNVKRPDLAASMATENLIKLKDVVRTMMEVKGLSLGRIIDVVNEATEANKIHGTNDNFIEIPDHPTRLKAAEIAARWLKMETPSTLIQINVKPILGGKSIQANDSNQKVIEAEEAD